MQVIMLMLIVLSLLSGADQNECTCEPMEIDEMMCFCFYETETDDSHPRCKNAIWRIWECFPNYPSLLPMVFKETCDSSIQLGTARQFLPIVFGGVP